MAIFAEGFNILDLIDDNTDVTDTDREEFKNLVEGKYILEYNGYTQIPVLGDVGIPEPNKSSFIAVQMKPIVRLREQANEETGLMCDRPNNFVNVRFSIFLLTFPKERIYLEPADVPNEPFLVNEVGEKVFIKTDWASGQAKYYEERIEDQGFIPNPMFTEEYIRLLMGLSGKTQNAVKAEYKPSVQPIVNNHKHTLYFYMDGKQQKAAINGIENNYEITQDWADHLKPFITYDKRRENKDDEGNPAYVPIADRKLFKAWVELNEYEFINPETGETETRQNAQVTFHPDRRNGWKGQLQMVTDHEKELLHQYEQHIAQQYETRNKSQTTDEELDDVPF